MHSVHTIDSHTEGEPTRVVISGAPDMGSGSLAQRARRFIEQHDRFRSAVCQEPRGFDALVGALLLPPSGPQATCGVIFFNNVGLLGMCGHGMIGVAETLRYLGRIHAGRHVIETPVGAVAIELVGDRTVEVDNVESYRHQHGVRLELPGHGTLTGDVAWGGNWFFLCADHGQELSMERLPELIDFSWRLRVQLERQGVCGRAGAKIDHIELLAAPTRRDAGARNFVLCPGREYDRSPCGTGTSAKLACLAADGLLAAGQVWGQESILGTRFGARYRPSPGGILPTITGRAWITSEAQLKFDPSDPFRHGIRRADLPGAGSVAELKP
jgi:4-hydroxyproline epimerase